MDAHCWGAGKRPVLVVGRETPLPAANKLSKDQEIDLAWEEKEFIDWALECERAGTVEWGFNGFTDS